jgi:hypothetical protein
LLGKIELGPEGYSIEEDDDFVMFFIHMPDSTRSLLLFSYHPTIYLRLADSHENNNNESKSCTIYAAWTGPPVLPAAAALTVVGIIVPAG